MTETTHVHEFESESHPNLSHEAMELGIRALEMRKCKGCGLVIPYIMKKDDDKWHPLIELVEKSARDILLA